MTEDMLEMTLRRIQASLHDLTNDMGEVKLSLANLNERVTALDARMDHAGIRAGHLEERVLRIERHLGIKE